MMKEDLWPTLLVLLLGGLGVWYLLRQSSPMGTGTSVISKSPNAGDQAWNTDKTLLASGNVYGAAAFTGISAVKQLWTLPNKGDLAKTEIKAATLGPVKLTGALFTGHLNTGSAVNPTTGQPCWKGGC